MKDNNKQYIVVMEEVDRAGGQRILTSIANSLAKKGKATEVFATLWEKGQSSYALHSSTKVAAYQNKLKGMIGLINHMRSACNCIYIMSSCKCIFLYHIFTKCGVVSKTNQLVHIVQGDDAISLVKYANSNVAVKIVNLIIIWYVWSLNISRVYISNYLKMLHQKEGLVIHNFVADHFKPMHKVVSNQNKIKVGYFLSDSPNKGKKLFEQIIAGENPIDIEYIVGTRSLYNITKHQKIIHVMPCDNDQQVYEFYETIDLFLSLSHSEGFSLTCLEAMAMGKIVISTPSGGVSDFIENRKNGFIVDHNSNAVAQMLQEIYDGCYDIDSIRREAIETAKRFTLVSFENSYNAFLDKVGEPKVT